MSATSAPTIDRAPATNATAARSDRRRTPYASDKAATSASGSHCRSSTSRSAISPAPAAARRASRAGTAIARTYRVESGEARSVIGHNLAPLDRGDHRGSRRLEVVLTAPSAGSENAAMFLNILVGLDASTSALRALEHAADLARTGNSKLTLMTVAPPVSTYVTLGGVGVDTMTDELDKWAKDVLDEAQRAIPGDVLAHTVQRRGHAGPEIIKELNRSGYDLIVLGSRGRGRAQEGLLGSVNGYVHFHAKVPLLSVPPLDGDES